MNVNVSSQLGSAEINLVPEKNLITGISAFRKVFGGITSLEEDILTVAAAIYAADLSVKRERAEDFIRNINLTIEIVNIHVFKNAEKEIGEALRVLSNDNWILNLKAKTGHPEPVNSWTMNKGKVLLFSGGLDSFCAAAVIFGDVVSHYA